MRSLAWILVLVTAGCALFRPPAATPTPPWPALEASNFGAMHNVSKCGEVWFGGGITAEDVELAQRRGVKSLVDLSFPDEDPGFDLGRECSDKKITYYNFQLLSPDALTDKNAEDALYLFRDTEQHPLLVVCGSGSNGAMFFALWRVLDHQMPFDDAREEALRVGMQPGPIAAYLKEQAERLSEKEGE